MTVGTSQPKRWLAILLATFSTPRVWKTLAFFGVSLAVLIVLSGAIRTFFVEAFKIPANSMTPTLLGGDHILVDKFTCRTRAPHRGEVIVFASPERPEQDFVKRVIAEPGDTIEVRNGHPWINGWEVPHCRVGSIGAQEGGTGDAAANDAHANRGDVEVEFLDGHAYLTFYDRDAPDGGIQGPWTVNPDESWVLGDNRHNSHDSRSWFEGQGGGVPKRFVHGPAMFVWIGVQDGGIDWHRFGVSLSKPRLPTAMAALQPEFERCLAMHRRSR